MASGKQKGKEREEEGRGSAEQVVADGRKGMAKDEGGRGEEGRKEEITSKASP
jgi:hypothetical protein